jgi:hypothetical protein
MEDNENGSLTKAHDLMTRSGWLNILFAVQFAKVVHFRQHFDRGMIDKGIMARHGLFRIPLSIIPLSTAFPGPGH